MCLRQRKKDKNNDFLFSFLYLMFGRDVFEDDLLRQLSTSVLEKGETYNLAVPICRILIILGSENNSTDIRKWLRDLWDCFAYIGRMNKWSEPAVIQIVWLCRKRRSAAQKLYSVIFFHAIYRSKICFVSPAPSECCNTLRGACNSAVLSRLAGCGSVALEWNLKTD